jgi:hypothetical protein
MTPLNASMIDSNAAPDVTTMMPDLAPGDRLESMGSVTRGAAAADGVVVPATSGGFLTAITVEHLLYTVAAAMAAATRIMALGAAPLSPAEAAVAWPALLDALSLHVQGAPIPSSALLHSLHIFQFWIVGAGSDSTARLPVALAGIAIVLLPWFWRDRLGRPAALVLAFLFALDPWLLGLSRVADAALLSAALALVALTALHTSLGEKQPTQSGASGWVAAAALGLLLASGVEAWAWLVVIGLYVGIAGFGEFQPLVNWRTFAVFAAAFLLAATGWFAQPQATSMVSASLSEWLSRFTTGIYGGAWPWLRLLVDQPFLLLFGAIGFVLMWLQPGERRSRVFLSAWLAWAILLLLIPGRTPQVLPLLDVPLAVLAAIALQWLLRLAPLPEDRREASLLVLVLGVILVSMLFWVTAAVWSGQWQANLGRITAGMFALVALLLAAYALWVNARDALFVGLGVTAVCLAAATFASSWRLAFDHSPRRPDGFFATVALAEARTLPFDIAALSDRRTGDATELPVQVVMGASQAPDAQVGWLLREMRNVRFVTAPDVDGTAGTGGYASDYGYARDSDAARAPLVVFQPAVAASETWNAAYTGSDYRLRSTWLPSQLPPLTGYTDAAQRWSAGVRPWLRWLMKREAAPSEPDRAILWARP